MQPIQITIPSSSPVANIPTPTEIRRVIAERHAEVTVLRRLLRAAESKARLCPHAGVSDRG